MGNLYYSMFCFLKGVHKMIPFRRLAILWLLVFMMAGFSAQAQVMTITGVVTDIDGTTLPGVNVVVRGTTTGTVTDASGFYSIQVESGAILAYSFVGMVSREIRVTNQAVINVALEYTMVGLDEMVVIGYGTQSRRTLTTAVSRVDAERIEDAPLTAVSTAIQGKVAGVRVYQSSGGQPGSNSTIRIRGGSSITQSNAPLILVDGVERGLADINPNDIESIQVLKDASGTAIYGARASNGVVLVTTKRGQHARANITFTTNTGFATPWKTLDLLNAEEYLNLVRPAIARSRWPVRNNQRENFGTGNGPDSPWSTRLLGAGEAVPAGYLSMPDPINPDRTIIFQDNDFQDITLNTALEQIHNLSASGGTENIRYAASLGYSDIEGTSVGTQWNRFSGRANVDFKLRDNLGLSTRMDHSSAKTNSYPNQSNVFHRSIFLAPTAKVYMEDGSYGHGNNRTMTNPLWYNDVNQREAFNYRTGVGASLNWYILPELKTEVRGDYFLRNRTFESFEKANIFTSAREAVFEYDQNKHWQFEGIVTYDKTLALHHSLNVVAGASALWFEDLSARSVGEGASTDLIWTLNAAPTKLNATTSKQGETLRGIFGRITYDYRKKYLFSTSLRRDESSRFAKETRVGYFPSVSAGWIMTEENFMANVPVINTLKLRGSLGQTGNNSINRNAFAGVYQVGYNYAGLAGTFPTVMPNRSLRWETTTQWDIGIDLGLFRNDRITILFDIYEKVTKDLLFSVPMPNESGFSNIQQNVGDVKYWGYEFDVQADILSRGKFSWSADFNFGYNMNKVLRLPDNGRDRNRIGGIVFPDGTGIGGIAEGERMGAVLGYVSDGIIDTWEEAGNALFDSEAVGFSPLDGRSVRGRKIPGDMAWKDLNGDGIIDSYDQAVLGYEVPPIVGGFGTRFTYGNVELLVFMDYAIGHTIADATIRRALGNVVGGTYNPLRIILTDAWQEEGDYASGKATLPRFDYLDQQQQSNFQRNADTNRVKGDFLAIREVRLSYSAPKSVTSALRINSLRVSLSGQNLHYFTNYLGWTPEYADGGNNYGDDTYPVPRKIMLGVRLGF